MRFKFILLDLFLAVRKLSRNQRLRKVRPILFIRIPIQDIADIFFAIFISFYHSIIDDGIHVIYIIFFYSRAIQSHKWTLNRSRCNLNFEISKSRW